MTKFYINDIPPKIELELQMKLLKKNNAILQLLRELDVKMSLGIVNEQVLNFFLMNEAVESTRIEGTQTTMQEMFEAQASKKDSVDIREVLNYINALENGKRRVRQDGFIASRTIKWIHELLLKGNVRGANCSPGEFRKIDEIWIGKAGSTRETASYVPPSHLTINDYMKNIEDFINDTDSDFPPIIATAIIHAQFESVHPFLDGNGRVGRMLIPLIFELKGDKTLSSLFISKQLENNKYKYYSFLNGTRKEEPEWYQWINFFMESVENSIKEAIYKYDNILDLYNKHQNKEDLNYMKVYDFIFSHPIVTISQLMHETKLSRPTITRVLNIMVKNNFVFKSDHKRNVQYICYDLLRIM